MNAFAAVDEMRGPCVCPKPIRIGQSAGVSDPIRPLRWQFSHQVDPSDLNAGVDLLDIFLYMRGENQVDLDPFFCGSPPTRSSNPLVHDALFGEVVPVNDLQPNPNPISGLASPSVPAPVPVPASARTGCVRTKFGFAPAAVRIEGFNCLDRDRSRSRGIPAVA